MDEAYYLADSIDIINLGKIIAGGTPEDLINEYGGGNTLIIRDCDSWAIELLANEIPCSKQEGSDIIVELPENDGVAIMSKAVALINDEHATCKELYVKKSTLEDVFLNLTGEKLVQEAA
jgi:ABC-2 type transport system ATP-binding protein